MKITCESCLKVYVVPDERLPRDKKVAFPCPACSKLIQIDLRSQDERTAKGLKDTLFKSASPKEPAEEPQASTDVLKTVLRNIGDLPASLQVVLKAREIMGTPYWGFKDIAKVLETDMAIAGRILKLANSAYYGLSGNVSTIQHASVVLGFKTLEEVITLAGTSSFLAKTLDSYGVSSEALWRHTLAVAIGAKMIVNHKYPKLQGDAFSAGLFHDAGKILLDAHVAKSNGDFAQALEKQPHALYEAEEEAFGCHHAEVAAGMCLRWKFPEAQIKAIKYHHHPQKSDSDFLAYTLHVADAIGHWDINGGSDTPIEQRLDPEALDMLGLDESDFFSLCVEVNASADQIIADIQAAD